MTLNSNTGRLSIHRMGQYPDDYFEISVEDDLSGIVYTRVKISPSELSRATSGLSSRKCLFEINPRANELVGRKSHIEPIKVERAKFTELYGVTFKYHDELIPQAVEKYVKYLIKTKVLPEGTEVYDDGIGRTQDVNFYEFLVIYYDERS